MTRRAVLLVLGGLVVLIVAPLLAVALGWLR